MYASDLCFSILFPPESGLSYILLYGIGFILFESFYYQVGSVR